MPQRVCQAFCNCNRIQQPNTYAPASAVSQSGVVGLATVLFELVASIEKASASGHHCQRTRPRPSGRCSHCSSIGEEEQAQREAGFTQPRISLYVASTAEARQPCSGACSTLHMCHQLMLNQVSYAVTVLIMCSAASCNVCASQPACSYLCMYAPACSFSCADKAVRCHQAPVLDLQAPTHHDLHIAGTSPRLMCQANACQQQHSDALGRHSMPASCRCICLHPRFVPRLHKAPLRTSRLTELNFADFRAC